MDIAALALVLAAIFAWGIISAKAAAISTPIFFVAIGLIMAEGLKLVHLSPDPHSTKIIAEVTLVWVLFADASRVRLSDLREDLGHYVRLLAIGLPLTIVFGTAAGAIILGVSPWYALLLGAALAPTDAALGSAVMSDRRVPYRVRQTLNVESGLNDGIATPVVTVALAAIAAEAGIARESTAHALLGLLLGRAYSSLPEPPGLHGRRTAGQDLDRSPRRCRGALGRTRLTPAGHPRSPAGSKSSRYRRLRTSSGPTEAWAARHRRSACPVLDQALAVVGPRGVERSGTGGEPRNPHVTPPPSCRHRRTESAR